DADVAPAAAPGRQRVDRCGCPRPDPVSYRFWPLASLRGEIPTREFGATAAGRAALLLLVTGHDGAPQAGTVCHSGVMRADRRLPSGRGAGPACGSSSSSTVDTSTLTRDVTSLMSHGSISTDLLGPTKIASRSLTVESPTVKYQSMTLTAVPSATTPTSRIGFTPVTVGIDDVSSCTCSAFMPV